MKSIQTKKGLLVEGVSSHVMACIADLHTGYLGESWCEQVIVHPGNIDELAKEMAYENATSYGSDGECICSGCGAEDGNDGDFCEEEGCSGIYVYRENENIYGQIFKIQPSRSMDYVNGGSDWSEVFKAAEENSIITLSEDKNKVLIYRSAMEQFLHLPNSDEWDILYEELSIHYNISVNSVEFA